MLHIAQIDDANARQMRGGIMCPIRDASSHRQHWQDTQNIICVCGNRRRKKEVIQTAKVTQVTRNPKLFWFFDEIAFSFWRTGHMEYHKGRVSEASVYSLAVLRPVDWVQREHIYISIQLSWWLTTTRKTWLTYFLCLAFTQINTNEVVPKLQGLSQKHRVGFEPRATRHELRTIVCIQHIESWANRHPLDGMYNMQRSLLG